MIRLNLISSAIEIYSIIYFLAWIVKEKDALEVCHAKI